MHIVQILDGFGDKLGKGFGSTAQSFSRGKLGHHIEIIDLRFRVGVWGRKGNYKFKFQGPNDLSLYAREFLSNRGISLSFDYFDDQII